MFETLHLRDQLYELAVKAYDPATRPELVATGMKAVGAEKYLTEKQVEKVANCTTLPGLLEGALEAAPVYCPTLYEKGVEKFEKWSPSVLEAKETVVAKVALARDADGMCRNPPQTYTPPTRRPPSRGAPTPHTCRRSSAAQQGGAS